MLSQEQFSACIDELIRLGVVKKVRGRSGHSELLQLSVPIEHLAARIMEEGYDEPPDGAAIIPWFACVSLKILLDEKGIAVSREELAGLAAVVLGFISESSVMHTLHSRLNQPIVTPQRRPKNRK
jgi:hypothetical protein